MATPNEVRYLHPPSVDVSRKKYCRFLKNGIKFIDYKDANFLMKFELWRTRILNYFERIHGILPCA